MKKLTAYWLATLVAMSLGGCKDDSPAAPPAQTVDFTISCCVGAPLATCGMPDGVVLDIPTSLTIQLDEAVTSGATVGYTAELEATLSATLGDTIVLVNMGVFDLEDFAFDLATTGSTPATTSFADTDVPRSIDVDADDDGSAEDTVLGTGPIDGTLTHDSAASEVVVSLAQMNVLIGGITAVPAGIPLTVPTPDPAPMDNLVFCDLPDPADTTVTFAVE